MNAKETVTLRLWPQEALIVAKMIRFGLTDSPMGQEWISGKEGNFDSPAFVADFLEAQAKKCLKSPVKAKNVNKKICNNR
jgi:hypothetical protein